MKRGASGRRYWILCTYCIVLVAIAVRCVSLGGRSWWIDELITRNVGRLPLWASGAMEASHPSTHSIISFTLHDTGPGPLTYVLDGCLARLAEPLGREFLLRLPGVIAGIATVILLLVCGKRWGAGRAGTLAMVSFAATYPLWVDASTGARGYSWAILVGLLQLDCLLALGQPETELSRRNTHARWLALCVLCVIGFMIHPFHTVWNVSLLLAAILVRCGNGRSRIDSVPAASIWCGVLFVVLVHVAWIMACLQGIVVPRSPTVDRTPLAQLAEGAGRMVRGLRDAPWQAYSLAWLAASPLLLLWLWNWRRWRAGLLAAVFSMVLNAGLCLVLLYRFFVVPRYFYVSSVATVWLVGLAVEKGYCVAIARGRRASASVVAVACAVALLLIPIAGAFRTSILPVHDWATTVTWLKTHARHGDLVLCGPNSDMEVFRVYQKAAALDVVPMTTFEDQWHKVYDTATVKGLLEVLSTGRRIWFVTPYLETVRPRAYWDVVKDQFRPVATVPGQGIIRILLHEAPPAAPSESDAPQSGKRPSNP